MMPETKDADPVGFKLDVDHHVHTAYSGHSAADMLVANIIDAAAAKGLRRVVILEHVPPIPHLGLAEWGRQTDQRRQIDAIALEIRARRDAAGCEVLIGAEIDAEPVGMSGKLMLEDVSGIDLVVAATHLLPGGKNFWFDRIRFGNSVKPIIIDRWFKWAEAIARNPAVDVFAHPGVLLAAQGLIETFEGECLERFERLFDLFRENDVAFELNELLFHKLFPEQLATYANVVRLAVEKGLKISLGSDSHQLTRIGEYACCGKIITDLQIGPCDLLEPAADPSRI